MYQQLSQNCDICQSISTMNCLLVAATAKEIAPFLGHYRQNKLLREDVSIDVLITGIGLTASAYTLTKQLQLKRPDLIIQAGVAGCFDKNIPLGAVVAIKQDAIADQGVIELNNLKTLFDLKLVPHNQFPFSKGWLVNTSDILKKTKLKKVKGISVNQATTSKPVIKLYRHHFQPVAESMEGAALHYVCLMENIPFLQVRSVSNYIGERNKKKWEMKKAISNLNDELMRLTESL